MISAFANTWKVPELKERIIYVLLMIVIVRLGVHVTLPGVNSVAIENFLLDRASKGESSGGLLGMMTTVFSGGGLQALGIFALGIMPYISASIMIQLMTAVVPKLAKLSREDGGRQKINQYTRIVTIVIALVQGFMLAKGMLGNPSYIPGFQGFDPAIHGELVLNKGWTFMPTIVLTIVAGTLLLMWIGDQMTERGIGNGTSMIITVNIISSLPGALTLMWTTLIGSAGTAGAVFVVFLIAFLIFVVAAVISITQAQRRIAIQHAKRVVGRKQFGGGQTQYLPLKLNYANVMPIIFATAILGLFPMIGQMFSAGWAQSINEVLSPNGGWYYVIAGIMIFFFSYFWVATMFQPSEIAENLKRSGGYIPGVRPGEPTAKFLDFTMTRLTFAGAAFLTIIFMLPWGVGLMPRLFDGETLPIIVTGFFGGTSLLIMVGVLLDIMRQVETHLLQREYDGFLRKGKLKGGRYDKRGQARISQGSGSAVYLMAIVAVFVVLGVVAMTINGLK